MRDFSKVGQITFGNPNYNHASHARALLEELKARSKDGDEGGRAAADCLREMRDEAEEEKISLERYVGSGDCIADILSDIAPEGFEFDVRRWSDGNYNYGYYPAGMQNEFE